MCGGAQPYISKCRIRQGWTIALSGRERTRRSLQREDAGEKPKAIEGGSLRWPAWHRCRQQYSGSRGAVLRAISGIYDGYYFARDRCRTLAIWIAEQAVRRYARRIGVKSVLQVQKTGEPLLGSAARKCLPKPGEIVGADIRDSAECQAACDPRFHVVAIP